MIMARIQNTYDEAADLGLGASSPSEGEAAGDTN